MWGVGILAPTAAVAAAKKHAASRSAQARRKAAEATSPAGEVPAAATSSTADEVKVLDFSLDEVRETRLVPVIDFKGRRFAPADVAANDRHAQEETDGGRIQ